jgi:hypothetical protein
MGCKPLWQAAVAAAAAVAMAGTAQATIVFANGTVTGDLFSNVGTSNQGQAVVGTGWHYNNTRNDGSVGINTAYARDGNGSAQLGGARDASKADIEFLAGGTAFGGNFFATASLGAFADLRSMSYDWYRAGASSARSGLAPAMRVLLDLDGNLSTNDRGGLVFERAYNGGGSVPTDTWTSETIGASTRLWNFGLGLGTEFDIDGDGTPYDTLDEWQASGRMANAVILGFSLGIGSGWGGSFDGAVDRVGWTIGSTSRSFNFEVEPAAAVPVPGTALLAGLGLAALALRSRARG